MAKTLNPVDFALGMPSALLKWAQSIHKTINGSIDQGVPNGKDSTGNYNSFSDGNSSGVLIRIGASGTSDNKYSWTTSNTPITINHGLFDSQGQPRQPIGVRLESSTKALSVYQPTTATTTEIFLSPTDATSYATVYVY